MSELPHRGVLTGLVALVTGSGRGIGRAIAELFSQQGAAIVVTARSEEEVVSTCGGITARGGRAVPVARDVADDSTPALLVRTALEQFGRIDIVVNNAAQGTPVDFADATQWEKMLTVNLLAAVRCARAAAPHLPQGGRIINISSIHAYRAEPRSSAYDVAKGGLDQLTRTLAVEFAPRGVLVNGIAPGFIETAMSWVDGVNELETSHFKSEYIGRRRIPLARAGAPEEVAWAALFLADPRTTYVTGHVLVVDGGLSVTF